MAAVRPSSKVPAFAVERWMDEYETTPNVLNLAETCAASISVDDLVRLNSKKQLAATPIDYSIPMTYGAILGSATLRNNIASLYNTSPRSTAGKFKPVSQDNVIVASGAISANYLVFYGLVEAGDHVISVYPTYQQLYSVPASLGADVSMWKLEMAHGYVPDVSKLKELIRPNTKMIVINNPNNPSGATIAENIILEILAIAKAHKIILFSDEVYAPLFHGLASSTDFPRSAVTLASSTEDSGVDYDAVVITGSMSKSWSLAGIRVGWAVSRSPIIQKAIALARDYTTISVSQIDDQLARYALSTEVRPQLAKRNIELARTNLRLLAAFVEGPLGREVCDWVRPNAGTTAFVRFRAKSSGRGDGTARDEKQPVDDVAFCKDLLERAKVMLVPGSLCFGEGKDFRGYVRIGYVCQTGVLVKGLAALEEYAKQYLL